MFSWQPALRQNQQKLRHNPHDDDDDDDDDDADVSDDVEEESLSQDLGPHIVRACAVDLHINMLRKPFHTEI